MNKEALRAIAKDALKVAFKIPRLRATQRTAELYAYRPTDVSQVSAKNSPTVKKFINKRAFGSETVDFFDYIRKYRSPFGVVASLGSHHADFERDILRRGLADHMDCYELSAGAIEKAKGLAAKDNLKNISFYQQDLNKFQFQKPRYDAVFAFKSLHHIENLENLYEQVAQVLKPDGYFFIDDFFGPKHLQWTDEQLRITNEILALLPDELKVDLGSFRPKQFDVRGRASVEENIAIDPSEAVRSDEVLPVMKKYFEIVEQINYGGNIHMNLFNKIMGNFREDHPLGQTIIRLILYIEELSIKGGILKDSDFKYIVARPL